MGKLVWIWKICVFIGLWEIPNYFWCFYNYFSIYFVETWTKVCFDLLNRAHIAKRASIKCNFRWKLYFQFPCSTRYTNPTRTCTIQKKNWITLNSQLRNNIFREKLHKDYVCLLKRLPVVLKNKKIAQLDCSRCSPAFTTTKIIRKT